MKDRRIVLVTGGREFANAPCVADILGRLQLTPHVDMIIEGGARGADTLARSWAEKHRIPCLTVWADWPGMGSRAGPKRNIAMLTWTPTLCVAFPGGRGTAHMAEECRLAGVPIMSVYP